VIGIVIIVFVLVVALAFAMYADADEAPAPASAPPAPVEVSPTAFEPTPFAENKFLSQIAQASTKFKTSTRTPNVANKVRDSLNAVPMFPELVHDEVWITGSRVWRVVLGEEVPEDADLDIFITDRVRYERVVALFGQRVVDAGGSKADRPSRSHRRGEGIVLHTKDGNKIDIWHEADDPYEVLSRYPSDSHAQCRAAYCFGNNALIVKPNELAPIDEGETKDLACAIVENGGPYQIVAECVHISKRELDTLRGVKS
jgi:hypothetical protein